MRDPCQLHDVPNLFETQEVCDDAVCEYSYFLQYIRYWFVTQKLVEM